VCSKAIHKPWWRSRGRSAVVGSERLAGFVDSSGPAFGGPTRGHGFHSLWIGDLAGSALDDKIEVVSGHAEHTARVSSEVPALSGALTSLEPE
jgi:hypothetical protein